MTHTSKRALYVCRTHICACPKHLSICISFPSDCPKHTFKKYASELRQTMKYGICDFLGQRKCAFRADQSMFRRLQKNMLFINYVLIITGSIFSTTHMRSSKCAVANGCCSECYAPSWMFAGDCLQTPCKNQNKAQWSLTLVSSHCL